jgi:hypothetical protein
MDTGVTVVSNADPLIVLSKLMRFICCDLCLGL